jgi:hypothetical protein
MQNQVILPEGVAVEKTQGTDGLIKGGPAELGVVD